MEVNNEDELPGYFVGIDFRQVLPSLEQKKWMVNRISNGLGKASEIAKRYNIKRKHLNVLVKRNRQGIPVHFAAGRPRVLDIESHDTIDENIGNQMCLCIEDLKTQIKSEYQLSFTRRYPPLLDHVAEVENDVSVGKRTLRRYVTRLHPGVFPQGLLAPNLDEAAL